ncbi:MAG: ClpP family protease [Candidatus Hydrogenedentota bacterium]
MRLKQKETRIVTGNDDEECEKDKSSQQGMLPKLLEKRLVMISGDINPEVAERIMAQLLYLDAESKDPIRCYITSPGGHVDSGYAIHDMMRYIDAPVITIGAGWVASIAVPILFGAEKDKRYCLPNTRFLLHQPSGGAGGQAADIRIEAQEIIKIRQRINKLIAAETGQPLDKVSRDSDRNYWLNAEEALEYGLVKKIVKNAKEAK